MMFRGDAVFSFHPVKRKARSLLALLAAVLGSGPWVSAVGAQEPSGGLAYTIAKIKPSIVGVGSFQRTRTPPAVFRGTGFAVHDGVHVMTNAHVLPEAIDRANFETLAVFAASGGAQSVRQAELAALDEEHDVAVLKIGGAPLPAIRLGDSDRVREGEEYAFTGFPIGMVLGLYPVTHRGIISAISPIAIPAPRAKNLDRQTLRRLGSSYEVFQLDATAYPGNSGSPLYDVKTGEVVGILNKVFVQETKENLLEKPSGISYAIPIKYGRNLLRQKLGLQ
ncbi:S1 family peptidase [Candidatus Methylocalor cossyra]|uniref:Serine protease MucD/AlgY associated with sigma factor RpoE n=1 Tax=Candidatus Methylocalor cossyra TaxID=3108543 RepID=A0ABM9NLZ7_9GAMM